MTGQDHVRWQGDNLLLHVYIQTRASCDEISGWHEKGLKIRLTAPPVDGAANKCLLKFISDQFKVSPSRINIIKGKTSRYKVLSIRRPINMPEELSSHKL